MCAKQKKKKNKKKNKKKINYIKVFNLHPELYTKPFIIDELNTQLWHETTMAAHNIIEEWLDESSEFVAIYDDEAKDDRWYHLPTYFTGSEFCVKPTKEEIAAGILYPGHRFIPFIHSDIHASKAMLFDGKQQISTFTITKPINELIQYHSILGEYGMLEYFFEDHEDNIMAIEIDTIPDFRINVMDMKDFYQKHDFTYGDAILMKVESFYEGRLSLSYHTAADETSTYKGKVLKWSALFAQGLAKTLEDNDATMSIHEQLAATLMLNADFLLSNPVLHIGGFLALSKEYSLKSVNDGYALIWDNDSEPELNYDFEMDFDEFEAIMEDSMAEPPSIESLDDILRYMGFDLSQDEIEAYTRDELFHGGTSYQNVMKRCLDERVAEFPEYEVYAVALDEHFSSIWADISVSYNRFADGNNGKIRAKALQIKDKQTIWMRSFNTIFTDITQFPESFMELAKSSGYLSQILVMLNNCDTLSSKEYQQMIATLDAFAAMNENMMNDIQAALDDTL
jgi:hypothetical protein